MNLKAPTDIVIYSIEKAIKTYRKFAQNNIRKIESNITVDQALLLILLQNRPELTQVEMAEVLFKDYASITRMIELMVKNEYLTRNESQEDRRRKELIISKKGENIIKKLFPVIEDNRNTALKGLSQSEIEQLDSLLKIIINNCN
ncbi:MarR family transcriptional regulator [Flagellimonas sp. 389]|uniref:MarR family winged helix-turn-helix transcriptional regulator n=1 Tax=Flagellimonas sp. 389 TaxID=2835862 RepID=UPI001BD1F562|nr:MarR family transcriptional regulator [Flagellimonas sp. 389]MBS9463517.1 MarR family transcriptional regulator [Flagellimonas sp. 389]